MRGCFHYCVCSIDSVIAGIEDGGRLEVALHEWGPHVKKGIYDAMGGGAMECECPTDSRSAFVSLHVCP